MSLQLHEADISQKARWDSLREGRMLFNGLHWSPVNLKIFGEDEPEFLTNLKFSKRFLLTTQLDDPTRRSNSAIRLGALSNLKVESRPNFKGPQNVQLRTQIQDNKSA